MEANESHPTVADLDSDVQVYVSDNYRNTSQQNKSIHLSDECPYIEMARSTSPKKACQRHASDKLCGYCLAESDRFPQYQTKPNAKGSSDNTDFPRRLREAQSAEEKRRLIEELRE